MDDPLNEVFETPAESLAHYLNAMPNNLKVVFQKEFTRTKRLALLEAAAEKMAGRL